MVRNTLKMFLFMALLVPAFAFAAKKDCPKLPSHVLGAGAYGATVAHNNIYQSSRKSGSNWYCTYTGDQWRHSIHGPSVYLGKVTFTISVRA